MHRPVQVAHNSFIEGSHTTKNTASGYRENSEKGKFPIEKLDCGRIDERKQTVENVHVNSPCVNSCLHYNKNRAKLVCLKNTKNVL